MKRNLFKTLTVMLLGLAPLAALAADANVQANLSPDAISLGQSAVLKLVINGSRSANPALPQVDGLEFENAGQSSQFSWVNGSMSSNVTLIYRVVPTKEGSFTIPPISCQVDGKNLQTQPLTLKVLKDNSAASPAQAGGTGSSAPSSATVPADIEKNKSIFGRITGVPDKMYVGQVVPVTISFYINRNSNLQINQVGMPSIKNDSFASSTLKPNQIRQSEQVVDGVPYIVVSAAVSLTAIKEGQFDLNAQWPLSIYVVESDSGQDGDNNDPFNDPFFRGFFRRRVEKSVTVNSRNHTVGVLALPEEGRPTSFAGAIGRFSAKLSADPLQVHVGDPLTMKLEIQGSGNFDRISAPAFADSKGWKVYPASNHFEPSDSTGIEGAKTFTQALIPQDGQLNSLPALEFSYFDPQAVQYVTLHPELPRVAILPAEQDKSLAQQTPVHPAPENNGPVLAPIRLEEGALRANLLPVTGRAWYWVANSGSLLIGLAGFFLLRRYRKQVLNTDYQQNKRMGRNIVHSLQALDSALANEDSAAFAEAASRALRERLAGLWKVRAESITTADVRARLGANGEPIVALFETADAVTYAGRRFSRDEMFDLRQRITEQLRQLEAKA
ncbi:MAG: BatD family protein [Verrucomicrobiales bacterium]|jgi:hypothetical protein|nr:BatD family protein [Verrucomicrobiales bacterium]